MPRTLLQRIRTAFDWSRTADPSDSGVDNNDQNNDGEGGDESEDDTRFVPSLLDYSVREAHGGGSDAAAREIDRIQQQAETVESIRDDGRR